MANHLHLLLQPAQVRDLPRIMQWIGWYSTMALSRLTGRCGHFWEARYFSTPIDPGDTRRVLATLRYIHANPKAASLRKGFHDPYSNYGHYERLEGDVQEVIRSSAGATGQGRSRPANLTGAASCCNGMAAVAARAPAARELPLPLQWQQLAERFRRANGARARNWEAKLLL
jgi:REP element-mobilizing transposase RayT